MTRARQPYETLEGEDFPTVRQLSVFLDNRLGQLLRLTQIIESTDIQILALSVLDSVEYAVVRLLFDRPDEALEALRNAGFAASVAELVVVKVPPGKRALLNVWSALLSSEVNISYAYSLLSGKFGSAVAIFVDNVEIAIDTLKQHKFEVLSEGDLHDPS